MMLGSRGLVVLLSIVATVHGKLYTPLYSLASYPCCELHHLVLLANIYSFAELLASYNRPYLA